MILLFLINSLVLTGEALVLNVQGVLVEAPPTHHTHQMVDSIWMVLRMPSPKVQLNMHLELKPRVEQEVEQEKMASQAQEMLCCRSAKLTLLFYRMKMEIRKFFFVNATNCLCVCVLY